MSIDALLCYFLKVNNLLCIFVTIYYLCIVTMWIIATIFFRNGMHTCENANEHLRFIVIMISKQKIVYIIFYNYAVLVTKIWIENFKQLYKWPFCCDQVKRNLILMFALEDDYLKWMWFVIFCERIIWGNEPKIIHIKVSVTAY